MFKSFNKSKNIVTLFTAPKSQVSKSLVNLVRNKFPQNSANKFEIEVTDSIPTPDQWRLIAGSSTVPVNIREEIAKFASASKSSTTEIGSKKDTENLANHIKENKYPILVDWDSGKVAINDESLAKEILDDKTK